MVKVSAKKARAYRENFPEERLPIWICGWVILFASAAIYTIGYAAFDVISRLTN